MNSSSTLFNSKSLETFVGPVTFQRGLAVYHNQQVLDCMPESMSRFDWQIQGRVQGSAAVDYEVSVVLAVSGDGQLTFFSGECTCPVMNDCKHSVALALKAAYKTKPADAAESRPTRPAPQPATAQTQQQAAQARQAAALAREQQHAERQVTSWLDLLGRSLPAAQDADVSCPVEVSTPPDFLVFTLSSGKAGQQKVLRLGYGLSRCLKNGNWAKLKEVHYLVDGSFPDADLEAARLIERLSPGHSGGYSYGAHDCIPNGASGLLALQLAAATGKLFFCPAERVLGPSIQLGPTLPIHFSWQEGKPAMQPMSKPMTALTTEPVWTLLPQMDAALEGEFFFNTPPLYLRLKAAECGQLDLPDVSAKHLQALLFCATWLACRCRR